MLVTNEVVVILHRLLFLFDLMPRPERFIRYGLYIVSVCTIAKYFRLPNLRGVSSVKKVHDLLGLLMFFFLLLLSFLYQKRDWKESFSPFFPYNNSL